MSKDNIIDVNLEDVISQRIARYSKYIIQDRALPDVRDGLKPVQRRILYAMSNEGNNHEKPYRKSAKTVGLVIGNYHPHGDSSVYEAMVRMAQDWKMNETLVDMQGNKGSIDDDPAAAMRYTEARTSKIASELIGEIDCDTVPFVFNFDDTDKEPTVFPAKYLNILVNGASGIAYGYATKIPTHNLAEVTSACIHRLNHPNCDLAEIMQFILGPDFPTGGVVFGKQGIIDAFTSGNGRIIIRAKVTIQEKRGLRQFIISEIPYEVIKSQLVEKIDRIRVNKEIDGLLDVKDESDRNGLKIVIDIKKDANEALILNYLYKNTNLQVYYNYNMVCIVDKKPMQLGLMNIIDAYLGFYQEFTLRLTNFEINKLQQRMHILEGLIKAVSVLDEVIALIRASKDKADAKNRLIIIFDFSEVQTEAIVMLHLYRLSNTDIVALQNEFKEKKGLLQEKRDLVNNRDILKQTITSQLQLIIDTYGKKRKSQLEDDFVEITIDQKDLIASEKVMTSISKGGYIKQSSLRSYKASDNYPGLREADQLLGYGEVDTLDTLIVTAKSGAYACLEVHQLSEGKWKDIGDHVNKYVNFTPDDALIAGFVVSNFNNQVQVLTVTANGQIRRCLLSDYQLQRRSKISSSLKVKKGDWVVSSLLVEPNDGLTIVTKNGFIVRYPVEDIPLTGMYTQGVRALNLTKEDHIIGLQVTRNKEMLGVFANNGSKRLKISDIEISSRTKKGVLLCKKNKSNPVEIYAILTGNLNDLFILQNGEYSQFFMKDLALMSLDSSFSSNIKLAKEHQIVSGLQYARNSK